jgi:hypothetical protein
VEELIDGHVQRGWIRPSLKWQLEHRVEDTINLPHKARRLDSSFVAPYQLMPGRSEPKINRERVSRAGAPHRRELGWLDRLKGKIRTHLSWPGS